MKCIKFEKLIVLVMVLAVSFATGAANADMVALYKFEGNANDSSGNNHHGIEKGSPSYVAGVSGQAIALNGKNSFVDCGTDASFDIGSQITVACWIKVGKFDRRWQTIIARGDNSWRLQRAEGNNTLEFACNGLVYPANPWIYGSINANDGRWHHVAGVYDGAKMYLYVDGVLDVSQEALGTIDSSTAPVYIGDNAQEQGRYFNGLLDELVIFDHALNADDIKQVYHQGAESVTSTADAVWSQVRTAVSNIKLGNETAAEAATERLLGESSGGKDVASGLLRVAETYRYLKKYEKSRQLCQYVVDNWPGSEQAFWSQMGVAMANIALGEPNAAAVAVDKLVADFSGNKHIAQAVHEIAGHCNFLGKHEKARELHQYVLEHWPGSEQAFWSQMGVAVSNVALGETEAADAAVDKLLADFSQNKQIADAVRQVADSYRESKEYEKAIQLYKYNVDRFPGDAHAMRSQAEIVCFHIRDGDDAAADAAFDKLRTVFSYQPTLPQEISRVADVYSNAGRNDKADQLRQYAANPPKAEPNGLTISAQVGMARSNISLGNDAAALADINNLIADFNDRPNLAEAIFILGEEYYSKALNPEGDANLPQTKPEEYYQKALTVWEKIITELPFNEPYTAHAYCFSAACYRELGKYEKAVEYFQTIVDNWPNYQHAWSAQCLIGECYEKLRDSGSISKAEAEPEIERAYQAVIENYPDCSMVGHACLKLSDIYLQKGSRDEAAMYLELFLETAEPSDPRINAIKERLEQLGGQTR
ncbi:MAG: LamG-like jellyroll fold domain-containing protein [Planctomycetota bacterium]